MLYAVLFMYDASCLFAAVSVLSMSVTVERGDRTEEEASLTWRAITMLQRLGGRIRNGRLVGDLYTVFVANGWGRTTLRLRVDSCRLCIGHWLVRHTQRAEASPSIVYIRVRVGGVAGRAAQVKVAVRHGVESTSGGADRRIAEAGAAERDLTLLAVLLLLRGGCQRDQHCLRANSMTCQITKTSRDKVTASAGMRTD